LEQELNILYAAAVSVVVTLTIEWFAKPWLEARKEHVLEHQRTMRSLLRLAHEHVWKAERVRVYGDTDIDFKTDKDGFIRLRSTLPLPKNKANREALMLLTDLMDGDSVYLRVGGDYDLLWSCVEVLEAPRWNRPSRRRAIRRMHKELQSCRDILESWRVKEQPPEFDGLFGGEPLDPS
jgi:hypothetical protein